MMLFPQLPLYAIAIICGILSFLVTRLSMPRIIRKLEKADIVGKDLHKSWKPIVAEMGGFGILFGFIIGIFSGICMHDILTFPLCIVLIVILLVGIIGIADDLLKASEAYSEASRKNSIIYFTESFLSRLLTYENIQGRMIVIMQRLHKNDLCGYLKEVARNEWEEVNLEAINKEKRYMRLETLDMRDKRVKLYLKKDIH